jgi:hypothetical protein
LFFSPHEKGTQAVRLSCSEVDVVYTWVNGSDPTHVARLRAHRDAAEEDGAVSGRFREYDVLRYSMRSVRTFLPQTRRIHLVVADDEALPSWLRKEHGGVRVVRHSQIMPLDALPTFNSNAIETNLHLIPGLAECFVYLNDDMLLGRHQTLDHYWDSSLGVQRVHFGPWIAPMIDRVENNAWHRAVARSNEELSKKFGMASRAYPLHGCYFFHKTIFAEMRRLFDDAFERTLFAKFRSQKDMVISFVYSHVAVLSFGA